MCLSAYFTDNGYKGVKKIFRKFVASEDFQISLPGTGKPSPIFSVMSDLELYKPDILILILIPIPILILILIIFPIIILILVPSYFNFLFFPFKFEQGERTASEKIQSQFENRTLKSE